MKNIIQEVTNVLNRDGKKAAVDFLSQVLATGGAKADEILFLAEWWNKLPLLDVILDSGAEVNAANSAGATALYYATSVGWRDREEGQRKACELLIKKGADVNKRHRIVYEAPPQILGPSQRVGLCGV